MRLSKRFISPPVFALFVAFLAPAVWAQTTVNTSEWQTLRPEGEEFSIVMPKDPVFESGKMPYHKMELNSRLYLSAPETGPVLAVVSLSGIKSNPAMYSELERMNSYVDAFKQFLVSRIAPKGTVAKLSFVSNKTLNGNAGREYQMTIGNRAGYARVFSTRRRFYAVAFLDTKKTDDLREQFLSSFVLPEYVAPQQPTVATQSAKPEQPLPTEEQPAKPEAQPGQAENASNEQKPSADQKPDEPAAPSESKPDSANPNKPKAPISGGVLNGKALSLPLPAYPAEARAARASGVVTVQVTIDEYGGVIAAHPVSGHPLLQQAAVNAALIARFSPTLLMGEPVKVTGVITYNFVAQ